MLATLKTVCRRLAPTAGGGDCGPGLPPARSTEVGSSSTPSLPGADDGVACGCPSQQHQPQQRQHKNANPQSMHPVHATHTNPRWTAGIPWLLPLEPPPVLACRWVPAAAAAGASQCGAAPSLPLRGLDGISALKLHATSHGWTDLQERKERRTEGESVPARSGGGSGGRVGAWAHQLA